MSMKPRVIPFRVGGPIKDPANFVGRKKVLQDISHAMLNLQNISLHGERRTGKTSLLLYLVHPVSSAITGLPEIHVPVYLDLQPYATTSAAKVWQDMAAAVAEQIERRYPEKQNESEKFLEVYTKFIASSGAELFGTGFARALSYLDACGLKIHLLLDEFDQTTRNPKLGDPFYDALRSLPTRAGNVSYIVATRKGLTALQPTYQISSPFFNIFSSITLGPFQEYEAHCLISRYFDRAGLDKSLAEKLCAEFPALYDVTGYHPFFLQALCYHLCQNLDKSDWPRGQSWQEALQAFEKDSEPHFEHYWRVSSKEERELLKQLAADQDIDRDQPRNEALVKDLENRCLVVQADEAEPDWRLFSCAFGKWINSGLHKIDVPTIHIPAGPFWMGSLPDDLEANDNEKPRRQFDLGEYRIGRYPVTNVQYADFLEANSDYPVPHLDEEWADPYNWDPQARTYPESKADHPVVLVSWNDAMAYCRWLSQITGQYYRLPTEEEWEKAARGGFPETRRYPWGDEWQSDRCNTEEQKHPNTSSVHKFEETSRSPCGIADMAGNVWEWTASWYERYPNSFHVSPLYGRLYRVVRGGSWKNSHRDARISCRGRYRPEVRRAYLGFRIVSD